MSTKTRSLLKALSVLLVLLSVIMYLNVISVPAIDEYTYWLAIMGFSILLISAR